MSVSVAISRENYEYLQKHVYTESGIVLDETKHYLLEARLSPIIRRRNLNTLDELCGLMKRIAERTLRQEVLEAMTTNETFFFRDLAPFECLKKTVLPEIQTFKKNGQKIRVWSAACSTGQEPYSLAILLLEAGIEPERIEILATDIASSVLKQAHQGCYSQIEINRGLPASYLLKYFVRTGLRWQVIPLIQKMIRFEMQDIRRTAHKKDSFDIIFCRNVLIYFDIETKKRILNQLHHALVAGGALFLGGAESTLLLNHELERVAQQQATFYRKKSAS